MAEYALVKDGVVVNVIVADQDFIDHHLPNSGQEYDDVVDLEKHLGVGIGHAHKKARNGRHSFTAPEPPEPVDT